MLERHKLLMGRTQDRAGQNNGSIGVFWRSFNGIIGHIRYMFRGPKITHNHGHSSLYMTDPGQVFPKYSTVISHASAYQHDKSASLGSHAIVVFGAEQFQN